MLLPLLLAVDFSNFSYATNPCAKNVPVPVVMRGGHFSYFDRKMGTGFDLHVVAVKEGSLRAGTRQAVVVLACDFPIGGTAGAYVFDEHGAGATLLGRVGGADWGGDWGRGPDSIHARFANRRLYVDDCDDPECARNAVTTYALRGRTLAKIAVRTYTPR